MRSGPAERRSRFGAETSLGPGITRRTVLDPALRAPFAWRSKPAGALPGAGASRRGDELPATCLEA